MVPLDIMSIKVTSAQAARAKNAPGYTKAPEDRKYTAWVVHRSGKSYGETSTSIFVNILQRLSETNELFGDYAHGAQLVSLPSLERFAPYGSYLARSAPGMGVRGKGFAFVRRVT